MSDLFGFLAAQALGLAPSVRPAPIPRFARPEAYAEPPEAAVPPPVEAPSRHPRREPIPAEADLQPLPRPPATVATDEPAPAPQGSNAPHEPDTRRVPIEDTPSIGTREAPAPIATVDVPAPGAVAPARAAIVDRTPDLVVTARAPSADPALEPSREPVPLPPSRDTEPEAQEAEAPVRGKPIRALARAATQAPPVSLPERDDTREKLPQPVEVRVEIGVVEVRSTSPEPKPRPVPVSRPGPRTSLQDYLRRIERS